MRNYNFLQLTTTLKTLYFLIQSEWKNKHSVITVFLFIFIATLITLLGMPTMDASLYSSMFWIVMIFTTLQGIAKSYLQMSKGHFLFWHQMLTPIQFLSSKLLFNVMLMLVYTLFTFVIFNVIHGVMIEQTVHFLLSSFLTGIGISSIITINSSIAAKTDNAGLLLPIMTFPSIVPILLIGIKVSKKAVDGLSTIFQLDYLILLLINILIIVLGMILVKYIWKD